MKTRRICCLGDSLTYGYDVTPQDTWISRLARETGWHMDNYGVCGDTASGMLYRLKQSHLDGYDAFFLMGGSNDILLDEPLTAIQQPMQTMLTMLRQTGSPVYAGIPILTKPESAAFGWQAASAIERHNDMLRQYRQWLLTWCRAHGITSIDFQQALAAAEQTAHIPLYADGVHPNAAGYAVLAEAARQCMQRAYE